PRCTHCRQRRLRSAHELKWRNIGSLLVPIPARKGSAPGTRATCGRASGTVRNWMHASQFAKRMIPSRADGSGDDLVDEPEFLDRLGRKDKRISVLQA